MVPPPGGERSLKTELAFPRWGKDCVFLKYLPWPLELSFIAITEFWMLPNLEN
jgi:hypothetical protein